MFWHSFQITLTAVAELFILGILGYMLVRKKILSEDGLRTLSRLVVEVIFPALVFSQLLNKFSFALYPDWWKFPLIGIAIMAAGLLVAWPFSRFIDGKKHKLQFLSLVSFQNSGYLPLGLIASILAGTERDAMLIYLFLLLLGFDLIVWSFGVYLLTHEHTKKFELGSIFSPPVIANIAGLLFVALGLNRTIPDVIMKPIELTGNCTLPLAMFIVGGNIAALRPEHINKKAMSMMVLAKLIILPGLGLFLLPYLRLPELMGLMILMQLAMPPATSPSIIIRHYHQEDLLISQGVFIGHIVSLITIPVFLSLYFTLFMVK
jgi:predicted permease